MKKLILLAVIATLGSFSVADARGGKGRHEGRLKQMDTNKDGKISKAEFTAHGEKKFSEMDANHDGFLTKEEMKAHWKNKKKSCEGEDCGRGHGMMKNSN